nr:unnamed protein product [Digitaria exilis]
MERLPDDVLAGILRRVPPRGLAACRCVSESWRAVVDGRRLLRADLLPISLGGIFIKFHGYKHNASELFSCPASAAAAVSGTRRYLPEASGCHSWGEIQDHCNGLVLVEGYDDEVWYVLNPATRWVAAPLPPCPPPSVDMGTLEVKYLAYDPAMSPDYEVISERSFAREGEAIGTVADMRKCWASDQRNAVYWRGILYVHCQAEFVMRISLASDKYHVIKPPMGVEVKGYPHIYLEKSANGVCCASIKRRCRVQIWNLTETDCKTEWVLKNDKDIGKCLLKHKLEHPKPRANRDPKIRGPWTLQDINYYDYDESDEDDNMEALVDEELEWRSQASSDGKSAWSTDDACVNGEYCNGYMNILGFHPFEEIIFLDSTEHPIRPPHLFAARIDTRPTVQDSMERLQADVLAGILRRVPPRGLAACRCVSEAWRGVDYDHGVWYVLNPATRWVTCLPPCPPPAMDMGTWDVKYLAYDPAMSPDYEVLSFSRFRYIQRPGDYSYNSSRDIVDPEIEQLEWPPFICNLRVFSSRTGQWEERSFVRDGGAIGTIADMRIWWSGMRQQNAVYWRGILYVHCQSDFVMRYMFTPN